MQRGKAQAHAGGGNAAEYPKQIRTSCTGIYHTVYHLTIKGRVQKRMGLNYFLSMKRRESRELIREGGLDRGFTVFQLCISPLPLGYRTT